MELFAEFISDYLASNRQEDVVTELFNQFEEKAASRIKEWYAYVTIEGVKLDGDAIPFGAYRLIQLDNQELDRLIELYIEVIATLRSTPEEKEYHKGRITQALNEVFRNQEKVVAIVSLEAEERRADSDASLLAEPICEILTLLAHWYQPSTTKYRIGVGSQFSNLIQFQPMLQADKQRIKLKGELESIPRFLTLNDETLAKLRAIGLDQVTELMMRDLKSCNELEKVLRLAIRFFYRGYTSYDDASEFIYYIIILEAFLSPDDKQELNNRIGDSVALLLGKSKAERLELKALVKALYRTRSKVVHGALSEVPNGQRLDSMSLASDMIRYVFNNRGKWTQRNQLHSYIEELKFE